MRKENVDTLKGFGILLMIMGHLGFGEVFSHYIHAFHMPIFFFVTGYLFNMNSYESMGGFVKRKACKLLIPYICFAVINILIDIWLIDDFDVLATIKRYLFYNDSGLSTGGALWFLTALFWANVIFYILFKVFTMRIAVIVGMLMALLIPVCTFQFPYSINAGVIGMGFMIPGYLLKTYGNAIEKKSLNISYILLAVLWAVNASVIVMCEPVNMRKNMYTSVPMFFVNALCAVLLYWIFASKVCEGPFSRWTKYISYFSKAAIVMIGVNEAVIRIVNNLFAIFVTDNIFIKVIIKFTKFGLVLLILGLFDYIIRNSKLRFMLGVTGRKKV